MRKLRYSLAMFIAAYAVLWIISVIASRTDIAVGVSGFSLAFVAMVACSVFLIQRLGRTVSVKGAACATLFFIGAKMLVITLGWIPTGKSVSPSVVELVGVFACTWAAFRAASAVSEFEHTVDAIWLPEGEAYIGTIADSLTLVEREVARARRLESPLALTVVTFDPRLQRSNLDGMLYDIEKLILRRFALTKMSKLLTHTVRRSDVVMIDPERSRFVVLSPDTDMQQVRSMINRVQLQAHSELGLDLATGSVEFPDDGVTFDTLLAEASAIVGPTSKDIPAQGSQPSSTPRSDGWRQPTIVDQIPRALFNGDVEDRIVPTPDGATSSADD